MNSSDTALKHSAAIANGGTRVKICGITSVGDARAAVAAGVDAIGLVFFDKSPRAVSVAVARDICQAVGPFVTTVGLFVNAEPAFVADVLKQVPLHVLQFHGDETQEECEQYGRPWYKAIRMNPALDPVAEMARFSNASGYLFDAYNKDKYGGTGETFDWSRVPNGDQPVILAGGLTPDNVAEAVQTVAPYAVDVSGGVESAPGQKDTAKMQRFVAQAKNALATP